MSEAQRARAQRGGEHHARPRKSGGSCTPRPVNVNTPAGGKRNLFPAGKKGSMRREGVTVFSRDLSYSWNEVLAHLACASPHRRTVGYKDHDGSTTPKEETRHATSHYRPLHSYGPIRNTTTAQCRFRAVCVACARSARKKTRTVRATRAGAPALHCAH